MSTNLECQFVRINRKSWYYLLQDWDCPVGACDWREHATCRGPFQSEQEALDHLDDHYPNPGGWTTLKDPEMNDTLEQAIKGAW